MKKSNINLIVAFRKSDMAIGNGLDLIYSLRSDQRHFRKKTVGNIIVMGRKTWDSLGKPLPDRDNYVLTRNPSFEAEGATPLFSKEEVIQLAAMSRETVWIIGGSEIYDLFGDVADVVVSTQVKGDEDREADVFLPDSFLAKGTFRKTSCEEFTEVNRLSGNECTFWIEEYKRIE